MRSRSISLSQVPAPAETLHADRDADSQPQPAADEPNAHGALEPPRPIPARPRAAHTRPRAALTALVSGLTLILMSLAGAAASSTDQMTTDEPSQAGEQFQPSKTHARAMHALARPRLAHPRARSIPTWTARRAPMRSCRVSSCSGSRRWLC